MGKFDLKRRQFERILPSGVPVVLKTFIGDHQDWITKNDDATRRNGIDRMLRDCIAKLGGVDNPSRDLCDKLLANDRAYALFELRRESNRVNPNFVFDYEFPVAGDGKRRKKRFEVIFNREDFPVKPFKWVYDEMVKQYLEAKNLSEDTEISQSIRREILDEDFPKMYDSYEEMLAEQSEQTVTLPDSEAVVHWTLVNVKKERTYNKIKRVADLSSHDQLLIHKPEYEEDGYEPGDQLVKVPIGKMTQDDIETLRGHIIDVEGIVDTSVVLDYEGDPTTVTQVNLIAIPAFFFPSFGTS